MKEEKNISQEIYKILEESRTISTTCPDKSYSMSKEAYHMAKINNLILEEGYSLIGMALACRAKSEISKVLDYSYNALEIFEALQEPLGQIKALNLIGISYFYSSMYGDALKYLLQALDLLEDSKDYYSLSCVLNNVGEVYRESDKYNIALEYYNNALKICTDNNFRVNTASLFNNIGEVHFLVNKYDEALEYFTKSYNILIEEKNMLILGEVENNIGKIHYIKGNYSKAEEWLFSALRRLDSIDNKFYVIDVLVNIAKLQFEKDSSKALYYFEKAIQYAENTKIKKKLSEVCKTVADYYEKIGNFKYALEYFKKYHRVNQEITTSTVGDRLEILKINLEHLKANDKLEKIIMVNERLEKEISNQRSELEKIQKLNEDLEKKALEDELTGVPNRRCIKHHLSKTWEESFVHNKTIAVFIIDIDYFKNYNDYWGHLKGDECLKKVARALKDLQVRRKDTFGRYGGEEFIYYAEGLNYSQAIELGNLIRNEVKELALNYTAEDMNRVVTISVGGALGKASDFSSIANMLQIADDELYKAKNMGRNSTLLKSFIE